MLAAFCGSATRSDDVASRIFNAFQSFGNFQVGVAKHGDCLLARCEERQGLAANRDRRQHTNITSSPLPDGRVSLFKGWFDNSKDIAGLLGVNPATDKGELFGLAVARWGDDADSHVIGQYCAIVADPSTNSLRLSRSPMSAPPLHYCKVPGGIAVASVLKVLFSLGLEKRLNRQKLADTLFLNATGDESLIEGAFRVGTGQIVHFSHERRQTSTFFDPLARRKPPPGKPQDWVRRADELLEEAAKVAIRDYKQPGVQLTGGLDSSNVAARVLRCLPADQKLHSFTFVSLPGTPDAKPERFYVDERPAVEAFAKMHPRIVPHFSDNADCNFDTDLDRFFMYMDTSPFMLGMSYPHRTLFGLAKAEGVDVMLGADWGNLTFSHTAPWAFTEYLFSGKWGQLRTLMKIMESGTFARTRALVSASIVPLLPDRAWSLARRIFNKPFMAGNDAVAHLKPDAMARYRVRERAREANVYMERERYPSRRITRGKAFARGDGDSGDLIQAFELIYGIPYRDVTLYRPFLEFCLSLPTEAFVNNGEHRWLAREMGRGLMPEEQRNQQRIGFQLADWHQRMTPRLDEFRDEIDRARALPEADELLDFDAIQSMLADWPEETTFDMATVNRLVTGVVGALTAVRYIRHITGSNQQ